MNVSMNYWMQELMGDEFPSFDSSSSEQHSDGKSNGNQTKTTYRRKKTQKAPRKRAFIANMEKMPHSASEALNNNISHGNGSTPGGGISSSLQRLSSSGSQTNAGDGDSGISSNARPHSPSPPSNGAAAAPSLLPMVRPSVGGFSLSRSQRITHGMMQPLFSANQFSVITTELKAPISHAGFKRQAVSTQMPSYSNKLTHSSVHTQPSVALPAAFPSVPQMVVNQRLPPAAGPFPYPIISNGFTANTSAAVGGGKAKEDALSDLFASWCNEQESNKTALVVNDPSADESVKRRRLTPSSQTDLISTSSLVSDSVGTHQEPSDQELMDMLLSTDDSGVPQWDDAAFFKDHALLFENLSAEPLSGLEGYANLSHAYSASASAM